MAAEAIHNMPLEGLAVVEDSRPAENLREHDAIAGWMVEYRQLEPGELQAPLSVRRIGRIGLCRAAVNLRIVSSGVSPHDMFAFVLSNSTAGLGVNGRELDQKQLLIIPPKTDVNISAAGGADALSLHISTDWFARDLGASCGDISIVETEQIVLLEVREQELALFRHAVAKVLSELPGARTLTESQLADELSALLATRGSIREFHDSYGRLEKHRVLVRAQAYVDEHLNEVIRVRDLCSHCGISQSTLERMFNRGLGVTPKGYIQATRLHRVRRELLSSESDDLLIADIAMGCGFTHMGRFSRRYREHFGRLPSEDRRLAGR